jgi:hypothetical protein
VNLMPLMPLSPSPSPVAPGHMQSWTDTTTLFTLLTGGGLVAFGTIASGWLANWLGSRRDNFRYEHEREQAEEGRRQTRLEQAYIELLTSLAWHLDWAQSVEPMIKMPPPDPLPSVTRWRMVALVHAYGSKEVQILLTEWGNQVRKIEGAGLLIRLEQESRSPSKEFTDKAMTELGALPSYTAALLETAEKIRARIQQELRGES